MADRRVSCFSGRVVGGVIVIIMFLFGILNLDYNYIPIHTANPESSKKMFTEAPKLDNTPLKPPQIAPAEVLKPAIPIDKIATVPLDSNSAGDGTPRIVIPLITYVYAESEYARRNLQFFIRHGLHDAADFIFILNGETDVDETVIPHDRPNVKVIKRPNTCFDLGSHWEVLSAVGTDGAKSLRETYERFILMNASLRGPFLPHWSNTCWSDAYLGKINEKVKLVGATIRCFGGRSPHIQSMIYATDSIGLDIILQPAGIGECFTTLRAAMKGEIRTSRLIKANGYHLDVMLEVFQSLPDYKFEDCTDEDDFLYNNAYYGFNVHPYETIFVKSHRDIDPVMIGNLTDWHDKSGYSSYDVCRTP